MPQTDIFIFKPETEKMTNVGTTSEYRYYDIYQNGNVVRKYDKKYAYINSREDKPIFSLLKTADYEVFGEYNEYYTYTTTCNAYGVPFYYSNSDLCYVYDYNLSIHHYYDINNAKIVIFGHSFVEADSLSYNRSKGFAYLLEEELGKGKVLNFGLGGDTISAMNSKIANSERFIKKCDYALLCIGTNDRGLNYDMYINRLKDSISKLENMGITPILFTIPHANYSMTEDMILINDWIRTSGYHYVDMYKVFANADGSCKEELFMSDKIHPTVEGHFYILNRIKFDCPFLF